MSKIMRIISCFLIGGIFSVHAGVWEQTFLEQFENDTKSQVLARNSLEHDAEFAFSGERIDGLFMSLDPFWISGNISEAEWIDVNSDGRLDLVVQETAPASTKSGIWLYDGDGRLSHYAEWPGSLYMGYKDMVRIDADADANIDLLVGTTRIIRNNGDTTFTELYGSSLEGSRIATVANLDNNPGDEVVMVMSDSRLAVFANNGSAQFARIINVGDLANRTQIGKVTSLDFNGDGWCDLAAFASDSSAIYLYENQQNGEFLEVATVPFGNVLLAGCECNPQAIDKNNDGRDDLVVDIYDLNTYEIGLIILESKADGTFELSVLDDDYGFQYFDFEVVDFNNDGWDDIVAMNPALLLYMNMQDGTFEPVEWTSPFNGDIQGCWIMAADIDGDSLIEVLATDYMDGDCTLFEIGEDGHVELDYADMDLVLSASGELDDAARPTHALLPVDLNNDGFEDLVVGNFMQPNEIYINDGNGQYAKVEAGDFDNELRLTRDVKAADVNGDGYLDLIAGNWNFPNDIYLRAAPFTEFSFVKSTDVGEFDDHGRATYDIELIDINGDNSTDILVGNTGHNNELYVNDGLGSFTLVDAGAFDDIQNDTFDMVVFEHMGLLAVAVVNNLQANELYVYIDSRGLMPLMEPSDFGNEAWSSHAVVAADFNNDTYMDLVVGDYTAPNKLYFGYADGRMLRVADPGALDDAYYHTDALLAYDVDDDGDVDVVDGSYFQDVIYINDGHGYFSLSTDIIDSSAKPTGALAASDADGDGDLDLIIGANGQTKEVYINHGIRFESGDIISSAIQPATLAGWVEVQLDESLAANTDITYDVLDASTDLPVSPAWENLVPDANGKINLQTLDPVSVSGIKLHANLQQLSGAVDEATPIMKSWSVVYSEN